MSEKIKDSKLNKEQWVIVDHNGYYWSGKYATGPFGRARFFTERRYHAKKYNSEVVGKRSLTRLNNSLTSEPPLKLIPYQ